MRVRWFVLDVDLGFDLPNGGFHLEADPCFDFGLSLLAFASLEEPPTKTRNDFEIDVTFVDGLG